MDISYSIKDWKPIIEQFKSLFTHLGEVLESNDSITYNSIKPDVETSISISKNGEFSAAMPLHGIGAKVEQVIFTESSVRLYGEFLDYTYRIPPAILTKNRGD